MNYSALKSANLLLVARVNSTLFISARGSLVLLLILCLPTVSHAGRFVKVCHPGGVGELHVAAVTKDGWGRQIVTAFEPLSYGLFKKCLEFASDGYIQLAVGRDTGGGRIGYYSLRHMGKDRGVSALPANDWRCVYAASEEVRRYHEDKWVSGTRCPSGAQPALFSLQITEGGRHFSLEPHRWLQLDLPGGSLHYAASETSKQSPAPSHDPLELMARALKPRLDECERNDPSCPSMAFITYTKPLRVKLSNVCSTSLKLTLTGETAPGQSVEKKFAISAFSESWVSGLLLVSPTIKLGLSKEHENTGVNASVHIYGNKDNYHYWLLITCN